jgi:ribosomal protein L19
MGIDLIRTIEEGQKKAEVPSFKVGDTVKVHFKIIEGKTERIQVYEGLVICFKNAGIGKTFTVRKNSYGVGVERVFPLTRRASRTSSLSVPVRYAGRSSTTSARRSVRPPRSRPLSARKKALNKQ